GSVLWRIAASAFRSGRARAGQGPGSGGAPTPEVHCGRCGKVLMPGALRCYACGLDQFSELGQRLRDLGATTRQLARFVQNGVLDEITYQHLQNELVAEKSRLTREKPAMPPVVAAEAIELAPIPEKARPTSKPPALPPARAISSEQAAATPVAEKPGRKAV